ncbi:MAG TPA: hypothetical protein VFU02_01095 [Polyangiaceae bacterium]|nr:hypothetical protein [Polyangiaceae bacterium]
MNVLSGEHTSQDSDKPVIHAALRHRLGFSLTLLSLLFGCSGGEDAAAQSDDSSNSKRAAAISGPVRVPCGIFLNGTHRDLPWVKGKMATIKWPEAEVTKGVFDFAPLEASQMDPTQRIAVRMLGIEPDHVVSEAGVTWNWIDPNPNHSECVKPVGCRRPVPWDEHTMIRYEQLLTALSKTEINIGGITAPLAEHPNLESIMLNLPGWGRIRELGFDIEDLPGYSRTLLVDATVRALELQAEKFPETPITVQFFEVDDGAEPPLWEVLRDTILNDPQLDRVGFYMENLAHSVVNRVETFRPNIEAAQPLITSMDQTYTAFQALTSWDRPTSSYATKVAGGSPPKAIEYALETFGARYFEIYAQDIDAATDGNHPEWQPAFSAVAQRLCD